MREPLLARLIASGLKVPPRPEPPVGDPASLRVFNAARNFYRYRVARWAIGQMWTAIGIVVGLFFINQIEFGPFHLGFLLVRVAEFAGIGFFLLQLPVTFMMIGLDYRYRWYMITDTSLRIREGLISVRERTMTFANIQNLSIEQGPLQRLLGISDLKVRTAGGGGSEASGQGHGEKPGAANMHLAYFRGVDNAPEIRDAILSRLRGRRDTGLGNPDEELDAAAALPAIPPTAAVRAAGVTDDARAGETSAAGASPGESRELLDAARELLTEARALRAAMGR